MDLLRVALAGLALMSFAPGSAIAQFAGGRDDPRRADPPVARPDTTPCAIDIIHHRFDSFEPARGRIDAAAQCPGPWQRIVLELTGRVNGRQYDRIGELEIGGVTVLRTSTPEPSGPKDTVWTLEKDLTEYAALFARPGQVEMQLGNVVNETYTGVFDVQVRVLFYPAADGRQPADAALRADTILPLADLRRDGTDTLGNVQLPANAERLVLEVYATGSGGGCEEFWYDVVPEDKGLGDYSCKGGQGPYREVQVLVDGQVAGIAAPFPHIYTGGWSNPVLWYLIPAPRAFDIPPVRFELTPFIGRLNDGHAHQIRLRVLGVPAGSEGWALFPNLQVWRDPASKKTKGELLQAELAPLSLENVPRAGAGFTAFEMRARHRFVARGMLQTSRGRVETTVERSLTSALEHDWTPGELHDGLRADWTDREVVTRRAGTDLPAARTDESRFGLEGTIDIAKRDGAKDSGRLTTSLSIYDEGDRRLSRGGRVSGWTTFSDRFDGSASYNAGVPREKREAEATSRQEYLRRDREGGCYRRVLRSGNGKFVEDSNGCGANAHAP